MTSAVGGGKGFPKSRQKEQNQLIFDSDKGEGVKKSEDSADVIYGSPLRENILALLFPHVLFLQG